MRRRYSERILSEKWRANCNSPVSTDNRLGAAAPRSAPPTVCPISFATGVHHRVCADAW